MNGDRSLFGHSGRCVLLNVALSMKSVILSPVLTLFKFPLLPPSNLPAGVSDSNNPSSSYSTQSAEDSKECLRKVFVRLQLGLKINSPQDIKKMLW